jgi:hypothetical protein
MKSKTLATPRRTPHDQPETQEMTLAAPLFDPRPQSPGEASPGRLYFAPHRLLEEGSLCSLHGMKGCTPRWSIGTEIFLHILTMFMYQGTRLGAFRERRPLEKDFDCASPFAA